MSVRILAAAAILTFFAALLVAMPRHSTSAELSETAAVAIDFDALRAEAVAALQALEQSHERRTASADVTAF